MYAQFCNVSVATVYWCQADSYGKLLTANLIRYRKFYLSNLDVYRKLHLDQDSTHSTTAVMHWALLLSAESFSANFDD